MSTGRVLVCHCCGEPLQVVCPTHGAGVVAQSWPEPPTPPAPTLTFRAGSIRQRLYDALHPTQPQTPPQLSAAVGITMAHVRQELRDFVKMGAARRVAWGRYVRGGGLA